MSCEYAHFRSDRSARHLLRCTRLLLSLLGLSPLLTHDAWARDPYQIANQRVSELERDGRPDEAVRILRDLSWRYEQDYAVLLRLAWLEFRLGQYDAAEGSYGRAVELSHGAFDARLGLAWTLVRLGRHAEAAEIFRSLAASVPDSASVRQGLSLTTVPALLMGASAGITYHVYANHLVKKWALAGQAQLWATVYRRVNLVATYRLTSFSSRPTSGVADFQHHAAFVSAEYTWPLFALGAQYAYLNDGSGLLPNSHLVGLSSRLAAFGIWSLAGNFANYADMNVIQGQISWQTPALGPLVITPSARLQLADDEVLLSGSLDALFFWRWLRLWVGGKLGDQLRAANLSEALVYDIPERVPYGLWGGLDVSFGASWGLYGYYSIDQFEQLEPPGGKRRSVAQYVGVGLRGYLGW